MLTIGIAGGSGSGKTTVVEALLRAFPENEVSVISQDAYYWNNSHLPAEEKKMINFDSPDSIEWPLLLKHIDLLKNSKAIEMPVYDYATCTRQPYTKKLVCANILIVEGILIYTNQELMNRLDIKVFVDVDSNNRLERKIQRDVKQRGRTPQEAKKHFYDFVEPMHNELIVPSKKYADFIIPKGGKNEEAIGRLIDIIVKMRNEG